MELALVLACFLGAAAVWQGSRDLKQTLNVKESLHQPLEDVFFAIMSSPKGIETRNVIRRGWLKNFVREGASYKFMIGGIGLDQQSCCADSINNDIVMLPFEDSYKNLTRKTEASARWASHNTVKKFFIKIDDDVYPDLGVLSELLPSLPTEKLYLGAGHSKTRPLYDDYTFEDILKTGNIGVDSKFAINRRVFNGSEYPAYAEGPLYILSRDTAEMVGNNFDPDRLDEDTFPFEDVNTALILSKQNVTLRPYHTVRSHVKFMLSDHSCLLKFTKEDCIKPVVAYHSITTELMAKLSEAEDKEGIQGAKKILCKL